MQSGSGIEMVKAERPQRLDSDDTAFETLFRQHQHAVYRWILRIVRNPATAEDLTIETFWRIYRAQSRFDATQSFEPWARKIATRVSLDWLRAQRPELSVTDEFLEAVPSPASGDAAIAAEIRAAVARAMACLAPKLRVAVLLAVIEERPHREVADALGISVTAVKVRVFRALRTLRKELREQGIEP